jgi:hypothetical protein
MARLVKRAFDLAAASLLLLFLAPLMAAIALKLRLVDGGSVVFAHTRVGRHGSRSAASSSAAWCRTRARSSSACWRPTPPPGPSGSGTSS